MDCHVSFIIVSKCTLLRRMLAYIMCIDLLRLDQYCLLFRSSESSAIDVDSLFLQVVRYLEHYAKVSRLKSRDAQLKDIDLVKMTITAGGQLYNIPFTTPMSSFKETRERLAKMDHESLTGLGRSPITIKEYRPPKSPIHVITFIACFLTFAMLSRKENVLPGSIPYGMVFKHIPKFANFVARTRPLVLYPMLVIHVTEVFLMTMKLEKHSVPLFCTLWWTWVISNFIEGVGAFQRYVVREILCTLNQY